MLYPCVTVLPRPVFTQPHMLSFSGVRLGSYSWLPGRSHGELGANHFSGNHFVSGQQVFSPGKTSGGFCHSTWACSSGTFVCVCICEKKQWICSHVQCFLLYSGLETWWLWDGGMTCGSTKALPLTWSTCHCRKCRPTWKLCVLPYSLPNYSS